MMRGWVAAAFVCTTLGVVGHAAPASATTADLTTGQTGSISPGQSFNETRGVDVTVLAPQDQLLSSLTLKGLRLNLSGGTVGARVYDSATQALLASGNLSVSPGGGLTVTIPVSVVLRSGATYRLSFFVSDGGNGGSGDGFIPSALPYVEATGTLRVLHAYDSPIDTFPANNNLEVPEITAVLTALSTTSVDLATGPGSTLLGQSFNETRGVDVTLLTSQNQLLSTLTLRGLNLDLPGGTVGARVYDSVTQALLASGNLPVSPGTGLTVTIPVSIVLKAGATYRLSFFVSDGSNGGSGDGFIPSALPYVEATGTLRVLHAYDSAMDVFPATTNTLVPRITAVLSPAPSTSVPASNSVSLALLAALILGAAVWFLGSPTSGRGRRACAGAGGPVSHIAAPVSGS
jgi:hypothetical protein